MRTSHFLALLALGLLLHVDASTSPKEQRVQIWQSSREEPLRGESLDPEIHSIQWKDGDLEVLFTQAAPCGDWLPVNPVWEVNGFTVVLNYTWISQASNSAAPTSLCKKYVRAWVFRVPQGNYDVSVSSEVPRFHQAEGRVFRVQGRE
jgi:hypothetical protein